MRVILLVMIGFSVLFGDEVFTDNDTGLMWQDNSDAKTVKKSWSAAKEYCQDLKLAGKSDWRLPSIKELQSIVDIKKKDPAIKEGFKNVASEYYWSSSEYVGDGIGAWSVHFRAGVTYWINKSHEYYVRCVRGRQ